MDTAITAPMEIDANTDGREGGSAVTDHGLPARAMPRRRSSVERLSESLNRALPQFQAARPKHGISPRGKTLLERSREMRRELNKSCHGDNDDPTEECLYGEARFGINIDGEDDDDDGGGENDEWKLGDPLHESSRFFGHFRNEVGRIVNLGPVQWSLMGKWARLAEIFSIY